MWNGVKNGKRAALSLYWKGLSASLSLWKVGDEGVHLANDGACCFSRGDGVSLLNNPKVPLKQRRRWQRGISRHCAFQGESRNEPRREVWEAVSATAARLCGKEWKQSLRLERSSMFTLVRAVSFIHDRRDGWSLSHARIELISITSMDMKYGQSRLTLKVNWLRRIIGYYIMPHFCIFIKDFIACAVIVV